MSAPLYPDVPPPPVGSLEIPAAPDPLDPWVERPPAPPLAIGVGLAGVDGAITPDTAWGGPGIVRPAPPPRPALSDAPPGAGYSIAAIILGAIASFLFPIILGPAGIVLAVVARRRDQRYASAALAIAVAGTVVGVLFGAFVALLTMAG